MFKFYDFRRYSESRTNDFADSFSPSRFTGRGWGMGPDLQILNYSDIGKISMLARNYLFAPAGGTKFRKTVD